MNPNLLTTLVLRQHLQRAYEELGEDLWPIVARIVRDIIDAHPQEDRARHDYEIRE
jgi:hypothetical protein